MVILASAVGDFFSGAFALIILLGLLACAVAAAIWFFRGPAKASDDYVNMLAGQFHNEQDAILFRQMYLQKGGKSTVAAWLLTVFLSPTISYLYQGAWVKAVISFITLQGFFVWWFVSMFTMPFETMAQNRKAADDAMIQLRLMRPNAASAPPPASPAAQPQFS